MKPLKTTIFWLFIVSQVAFFAFIWWILTDGAASSWWIGMPAVLLTVTLSAALIQPVYLNGYELLKFVPFFLMRSLLGGADVAWRAIHPSMPIAPDLIDYPLQLPPGLPQIFMANMVSLLPGTLSAVLDKNILQVHVLDRRQDYIAELKAVERIVARMFYASENLMKRQENEAIQ